MKALELIGEVDETHRLQVQVPEALPPGLVRILVLIPEEDDAGGGWLQGIAREWAAELRDPREDIYTLGGCPRISTRGSLNPRLACRARA